MLHAGTLRLDRDRGWQVAPLARAPARSLGLPRPATPLTRWWRAVNPACHLRLSPTGAGQAPRRPSLRERADMAFWRTTSAVRAQLRGAQNPDTSDAVVRAAASVQSASHSVTPRHVLWCRDRQTPCSAANTMFRSTPPRGALVLHASRGRSRLLRSASSRLGGVRSQSGKVSAKPRPVQSDSTRAA